MASAGSSSLELKLLLMDPHELRLTGSVPSEAGIPWPCVLKATKLISGAAAGIL